MRNLKAATLLVLATLALNSCVAAEPEDSRPVSSPTPTAVDIERELYGEDALFLSEFVTRHPDYFDPELLPRTFLVEHAGVGSQRFNLPALEASSNRVIFVIFCDGPSKYEVALVSGTEILDRTWGESCADGGLVTYTTATITAKPTTLEAAVTVDDETAFRLSVLEVGPGSQ